MQESKWKDHKEKGRWNQAQRAKIEEAGPSGGEDRLRILTFIPFLDMHELTDAQVHGTYPEYNLRTLRLQSYSSLRLKRLVIFYCPQAQQPREHWREA
ncbi:uncharacterized protein PpBr36_09640 [Pyricularia pennisetigena]|uniref:uncharacterized protein n=1 Tax=Pyricularia pennisetigena TaxID=1578925 RepID=UPI00114FCE83|nr:uncharacterized protein PpBr36_09640 [Pyricularia pennisetigena]TLS21843.1 hypothetical protein PpBr36_09640 [Pyricularia pennisetigena]